MTSNVASGYSCLKGAAYFDNIVRELWVQLVQLIHCELVQGLILLLCNTDGLSGDVVRLSKRHTLAPENSDRPRARLSAPLH